MKIMIIIFLKDWTVIHEWMTLIKWLSNEKNEWTVRNRWNSSNLGYTNYIFELPIDVFCIRNRHKHELTVGPFACECVTNFKRTQLNNNWIFWRRRLCHRPLQNPKKIIDFQFKTKKKKQNEWTQITMGTDNNETNEPKLKFVCGNVWDSRDEKNRTPPLRIYSFQYISIHFV